MKRILAVLVVLFSSLALAHPRDELVQAAYLQLAPDSVELEIDLTAGDLVAKAFLSSMDTNRNGTLEDGEAQTYAAEMLRQLRLSVDGQSVLLELESVTTPSTAALLAGGGVMQLKARAPLTVRPGAHTLEFVNSHAPVNSGYLSNAFVSDPLLQMNQQTRSDDQSAYRLSYTLAGADNSSMALWGIGAVVAVSSLAGLWLWQRGASNTRLQRSQN
jgi:hypothetical protein